MASEQYGYFGVTWDEVIALLGGDSITASDVAKRKTTVGAGSTTTAIVVGSTIGFAAGDKVNINTGDYPPEGETHAITEVTSATVLGFDDDEWATAPANGDTLNDGPEQVELIQEHIEAEIESRLPDRYARALRAIEGEVLCRYAQGTETSFTLSIATPTADTLYLWKNLRGTWKDRWRFGEMASSEYSLSDCTVTVDALAEGTSLIAEYKHNLSSPPPLLARVMRLLSAAEVADVFGLSAEPTPGAAVERYRTEGKEILDQLVSGGRTIPMFERVNMFDDVVQTRGVMSLDLDMA